MAHQLACLELDASFLASRVLPGFASGIHQSLLSSTMCQRFCTGRVDAHARAVANFLCYLPCVISLDLAVSGRAIRNRVVCVPKKDLDNSAECKLRSRVCLVAWKAVFRFQMTSERGPRSRRGFLRRCARSVQVPCSAWRKRHCEGFRTSAHSHAKTLALRMH